MYTIVVSTRPTYISALPDDIIFTHSCFLSCPNTLSHGITHILALLLAHALSLSLTHAHLHSLTHSRTLTLSHTLKLSHTQTHTHAHARTSLLFSVFRPSHRLTGCTNLYGTPSPPPRLRMVTLGNWELAICASSAACRCHMDASNTPLPLWQCKPTTTRQK